MLPDRPLSTVVGMDLSPPPVEMGNSEISSSVVPPDALDEASASFHSTPEFYTASHTEHITSTHTLGPVQFYTGPLPVPTTTTIPGQDFYNCKNLFETPVNL